MCRRRCVGGATCGDTGSASVLGVQLIAMLAVVTLVWVAIAALVLAHRRAQAAADLAALAGATAVQQGDDACTAAATVAGLNHGRLGSCRVAGDEVLVEVRVRTAPLLGRVHVLSAQARAGPATPDAERARAP